MTRMLHLLVATAFISALSPAVAAEPKELRTLKGTGGSSLVFSPDGKTLASNSRDDGQVKLWDVKSGEELATLKVGKSHSRLAFSPDGKTLAVAQYKEVILLDVETRKERFSLKADGGVLCIAFRPKTNTLVIGVFRGDCKLWDAETGKEQATLKQDNLSVHSTAFSPDGKLLAFGHQNGTVTVWDVETQKKVASGGVDHGFGNHSVKTITFTPDATKLIFFAGTGGYGPGDVREQSISHWEFAKEKKVANTPTTANGVSNISFSPDGRWLATAVYSPDSLGLDPGPGSKPVTAFKGVRLFAFSPDSKILATVGEGKTITLWELDPEK